MSPLKSKNLRLFACTTLVCIIIGFASMAMAAPSLQWHTDSVYYDPQGRLIIEGYFYNNGTRTVIGVNRFDVSVWFRQQNTNWWEQAAASYYDLNVYLNPGQSVRWTFRILDVSYSYFDYWNIRWNVNYQYQ